MSANAASPSASVGSGPPSAEPQLSPGSPLSPKPLPWAEPLAWTGLLPIAGMPAGPAAPRRAPGPGSLPIANEPDDVATWWTTDTVPAVGGNGDRDPEDSPGRAGDAASVTLQPAVESDSDHAPDETDPETTPPTWIAELAGVGALAPAASGEVDCGAANAGDGASDGG